MSPMGSCEQWHRERERVVWEEDIVWVGGWVGVGLVYWGEQGGVEGRREYLSIWGMNEARDQVSPTLHPSITWLHLAHISADGVGVCLCARMGVCGCVCILCVGHLALPMALPLAAPTGNSRAVKGCVHQLHAKLHAWCTHADLQKPVTHSHEHATR